MAGEIELARASTTHLSANTNSTSTQPNPQITFKIAPHPFDIVNPAKRPEIRHRQRLETAQGLILENGSRSMFTFRAMPWYEHWRLIFSPSAASLQPST